MVPFFIEWGRSACVEHPEPSRGPLGGLSGEEVECHVDDEVLLAADEIAAADLEQEARTRELVGRATGILMERYHLSAERSQGYLVRSSTRAELEVSDLAREIVAAQDRAATRIRASSEDAGPSRG